MRDKYTNLTDTQLDTYTKELHNNHNNAGNEVSHYCTGLYCTVYATCSHYKSICNVNIFSVGAHMDVLV